MNYEITALNPEIGRLQVRYTNSLNREVFLTFVVESFLEEDLHAVAQEGILKAFTYFKNTNEASNVNVSPDSLENKTGHTGLTDYIPTNPPEYDVFNEYLDKSMVEDNGILTEAWQVLPLTTEQKDQIAIAWRVQASVSMRQARLALSRQGLLGQVQAGIDALPEESQIEWEYAGFVERNSPLVQSLGSALGLTDEQLDDLFILAATL